MSVTTIIKKRRRRTRTERLAVELEKRLLNGLKLGEPILNEEGGQLMDQNGTPVTKPAIAAFCKVALDFLKCRKALDSVASEEHPIAKFFRERKEHIDHFPFEETESA